LLGQSRVLNFAVGEKMLSHKLGKIDRNEIAFENMQTLSEKFDSMAINLSMS
jgi:hypothetical protein